MRCPLTRIVWTLLVSFAASMANAQELFLITEPASSVPKGVIGVRAYTENYKEYRVNRGLNVIRVMYGLTPRWSVMATASLSNHHSKKLPNDLLNHSHTATTTTYYAQPIKRGVRYPYTFNGVYLFSKYRFVSIDEKYKHFRMAVYADWSKLNTAHDEAEPTLLDDTSGFGGGLITTWLKGRFAMSMTTGFIKPRSYSEYQRDLSGGPDMPTTIYYGDAIKYSLSFGYRLYPKKYEGYDQVNWNFYMELAGKAYEPATIIQNGAEVAARAAALKGGSYIEIYPGIQRIIDSNTRVEVYYGFRLLGNSFIHFPPIYAIAIQRYFYRAKK